METSGIINASCATLWNLLTDTSRWVEWGPSVLAVECSERYIQLGSKGRVRSALGLWAPFAITEMDDGRYWSWHVFGFPATGHRVDRVDKGVCRLVFQVPIFAASYVIVCRIALHRITRILKSQ
ncbi:MAG: SRPBCC family protein [Deltaproteobacteria bacterium]|nr:SRPBCC family protein [Deltaproteobacteria bacterium]